MGKRARRKRREIKAQAAKVADAFTFVPLPPGRLTQDVTMTVAHVPSLLQVPPSVVAKHEEQRAYLVQTFGQDTVDRMDAVIARAEAEALGLDVPTHTHPPSYMPTPEG